MLFLCYWAAGLTLLLLTPAAPVRCGELVLQVWS